MSEQPTGSTSNVRELQNLIFRECLLSDEAVLDIVAPASLIRASTDVSISDAELSRLTYRAGKARALREFDRCYLTQLIQRTQGNVTKAAQLAGKERRALGRLLKRYHINYIDIAEGAESCVTGSSASHHS